MRDGVRLKRLVGVLRRRLKGDFREQDHPRADDGKFGEGGGGSDKPAGGKPTAPKARFNERGAEQAVKHRRRIVALLIQSEQGKIDADDLRDQTKRVTRKALAGNGEIFGDLENMLYERVDAEYGHEVLGSEQWGAVKSAIAESKKETDKLIKDMGRIALTYVDWPTEDGSPRKIQKGDKEELGELYNSLVSAYDASVHRIVDAFEALTAKHGRGKSSPWLPAVLKGDFREQDHPRADDGKFGEGSGGGREDKPSGNPRTADRSAKTNPLVADAIEHEIRQYAKVGLSPDDLNSGECLMVARRVVESVRAQGGTAYYAWPRVGPAHVWVLSERRNYDAQHPGGVDSPGDLTFFKDNPDLLRDGVVIEDDPPANSREKSWSEQDHPRGNDGKFGGGGGGAKPGAAGGAALPETAGEAHRLAQEKARGWLKKLAGLPAATVELAAGKARKLYDRMAAKYGKGWARAIVSVGVVTFPTPFTAASVLATIGLAKLCLKLSGRAMTAGDVKKLNYLLKQLRRRATTFKEQDGSSGDDTDERAGLIAEILVAVYGDTALDLFDAAAGQRSKSWREMEHPRGPDGRFIEGNSPEARAAASGKIRTALKSKPTPESLKSLVEHLSILTVKQLQDLKREYGLKASGKDKEALRDKIAERLHKARRDAAPEVDEGPSREQTAWEQSLSEEQRDAINIWESTFLAVSAFRKLSAGGSVDEVIPDNVKSPYEREKLAARLTRAFSHFDSSIQSAPPHKGTVYRGMYDVPGGSFTQGARFSIDSYSSTAKQEKEAYYYASRAATAAGNEMVLLELEVKTGANISGIHSSLRSSWDEVVIRPATQFEVTEVSDMTFEEGGKQHAAKRVKVREIQAQAG